jgi:signal transduction histidine kinase
VLIWGIGCLLIGKASNAHSALLGWKIAITGGLFIGAFFYHTIYIFTNLQKKKVLLLVYTQAIIYCLLAWISDNVFTNWQVLFGSIYYPHATLFYTIMSLSWVIVVFIGHKELFVFLKKSKGTKLIQAKYLFIAFIIGFIGGGSTLIPAFKVNIYPIGNFSIPLYTLTATYAILRHRLMDIRLVFKRTMAYSLAAGILTSIFVVLVLFMTTFVSDAVGMSSFTVTVIAALLIAVLFNPLRNRIQKLIDKLFYKKSYDYYETVQKVSHDLSSMFDFKSIFSFIGDILFTTLGLKNVYVLSSVTGGDFEVFYHRFHKGEEKITLEKEKLDKLRNTTKNNKQLLKFNKDAEFIKLLHDSTDIIIKDELPGIVEIIGQETIDNVSDTLRPFQGEVLIPVFVDKQISVLIILGEKISGDIFTNEDINLLNTIATQTAIAMKNASLYSEKVSSEKFASMGLMSATFAHEVRNPLTSIKTFIQLMPEKYNDTEFREIFSKIVVSDVERIDGLIKELLSYSSGKISTFQEKLDLISLIDEVTNYLKNKLDLENRHISVEKIYKSVKINILGDPKKLKQVFMNIITNGCQSMNEHGILTINITPNDKKVDVSISDTGSGMSQEDVEKIFDPFFTTKPMGLGLGLAICKKIIDEHQGVITVDSEISSGTTFTVSLPLQN